MRTPAAVLALTLVIPGCTSTRAAPMPATTTPTTPASTPTGTTVDGGLAAVEDAYGRYASVLPLERHVGSSTLTWTSGSYRLHYLCAGGGRISFYDGLDVLDTRELGRSSPRLLQARPCEGVPGQVQVLVDGSEPRAVRVRVKDGIAYTAGVTELRLEDTAGS